VGFYELGIDPDGLVAADETSLAAQPQAGWIDGEHSGRIERRQVYRMRGASPLTGATRSRPRMMSAALWAIMTTGALMLRSSCGDGVALMTCRPRVRTRWRVLDRVDYCLMRGG
jgi:hypothetical protein